MANTFGNLAAATVPGVGMVTGLGPVAGIAKDMGWSFPTFKDFIDSVSGAKGDSVSGPGAGAAGTPGSATGGTPGPGSNPGQDPQGQEAPSGGTPSGSSTGADPDSSYAKGGMVTRDRLIGPNPPGPDEGYAALQSGEVVIPRDKARRMMMLANAMRGRR